jgi:YegS/Rv2252/BmrU family lipid kinase
MMAETHNTSETNEEMILAGLHTYDIEPEVWYTTSEDAGEELATRAADEHTDLVIAAGGDGTIHAVASGLIGRESTLGIIPLGTMNNLAHSLGIPLQVEAACAIIAKGETRAIDVGKINEQVFIEVAGIGLEAALFPAAEEIMRSGILSTVRGVFSGLFTLFAFQTIKLKISFDDKKRRPYEAIQVTICNAPYYGAHFQIATNIVMDDGELDVVIYKNFSKLEYIQHAISISQGRRVFQPKITHRRVKSLRITADHPVEIQADGLPYGYTPATVTITPGALRVRTPTTNSPGLQDEPLAEQVSSLRNQ